MSVRHIHPQSDHSIYFVTFTCFQWKWLFEMAMAYDAVYTWFDYLYKKGIRVNGYVIMPNHLHAILYFREMKTSLNKVIGNGKRFMAYDIINRLERMRNIVLLEDLWGNVKKTERKKGQKHRVFEESFDAKECLTRRFVEQKLRYIHKNPVAGRWNLVDDFTMYPYSSAGFYERGIINYDKLMHIAEVW